MPVNIRNTGISVDYVYPSPENSIDTVLQPVGELSFKNEEHFIDAMKAEYPEGYLVRVFLSEERPDCR